MPAGRTKMMRIYGVFRNSYIVLLVLMELSINFKEWRKAQELIG